MRFFLNATVIFLSHAMGCVDVSDTVHMVRLRCIFVCDIASKWVSYPFCAIAMCDSSECDVRFQCITLQIVSTSASHLVNKITKSHATFHFLIANRTSHIAIPCERALRRISEQESLAKQTNVKETAPCR